ncbi:unnamed protein product [Cyprideis torosa]|uniref:Beta-hexosaminidase n=1 Tax=Cyprideis torosa TaxID=163714 RepID=A0A7R8ZFI1_9CRUS|nr:unnamed protein product [Cyprideis torosa]CAG0879157.1 unnamed protein product [Cyprideis torosa]
MSRMFLVWCTRVLLFLPVSGLISNRNSDDGIWSYDCVRDEIGRGEQRCARQDKASSSGGLELTLEVCKLICGQYGQLWPLPKARFVQLGNSTRQFLLSSFTVKSQLSPSSELEAMVNEAAQRISQLASMLHPEYPFSEDKSNPLHRSPVDSASVSSVEVRVRVVSDSLFGYGLDESYSLSITSTPKKVLVVILAETFFGARHGLETLLQCMAYDSRSDSLRIIETVTIDGDSPDYQHRGLSLDSSRSYTPIPLLKKIIDAMGMNKMNILHWHITDTHSFPFQPPRRPLVGLYGAYSPRHVYYPEDVRDLVHFARVRGVKIIPELDAPSHCGNEPPCGQLNPVNENVYDVLEDLYADFLDVFDGDIFHMGGDEVMIPSWNKTDHETVEILEYLSTMKWDRNDPQSFVKLWGDVFQKKAFERLRNLRENITAILWTSELTNPSHVEEYLHKDDYIIQLWTDSQAPSIAQLAKQGYRLIFTNYDAWYLDCGFAAWVGSGHNWCSPYKELRKQIQGGEVAMWAEQTDEHNVETKIWPRASAMAERLWSNPETGYEAAEARIQQHRDRMAKFGIGSELLQPEFCRQNEGLCYLSNDAP